MKKIKFLWKLAIILIIAMFSNAKELKSQFWQQVFSDTIKYCK